MKLGLPQKYEFQTCKVKGKNTYRVKRENKVVKFSAPASSKKIPKLYIFHDSRVIHYVGITRQSMASRLCYGLKAKGTHGYHGYRWKRHPGKLVLLIWKLENIQKDKEHQELETIEAEIVFLYRCCSGQWPKSQHEIHFHKSGKCHRKCAQGIYKHIKSNIKRNVTCSSL